MPIRKVEVAAKRQVTIPIIKNVDMMNFSKRN